MATDMIARAIAMDAKQGTVDITAALAAKADLVNGVVPLNQIPPAAIEREVVVADDAARFALTTDTVQLGDTVKVTSTNKMYLVVDTDHLDTEAGYSVYVAGKAAEAVADQNGNVINTTYARTADLGTAAMLDIWEGTRQQYEALQTDDYDYYFVTEAVST